MRRVDTSLGEHPLHKSRLLESREKKNLFVDVFDKSLNHFEERSKISGRACEGTLDKKPAKENLLRIHQVSLLP